MTCRATKDRFLFFLLFLLVSLVCCAEAQDGGCFDTLSFRIENEDDLVFFWRALQDLSLDENLDGPGPYLVFAPTDSAFESLKDDEDAGSKKDAELLEIELMKLISYHVGTTSSYDRYRNKELGNRTFEIETLCKDCSSLVVDPSSGKVTLNGEARLLRSIQACNGLLLVMDQILVPRKEGDALDSEEGIFCDPEDPTCCDVRPRAGEFTCAEQKFYDFCETTAGTAASFCRYTCGFCGQAREEEGPRGKDGDYSYHHEVSRRVRARKRKKAKGGNHRGPLKEMRGKVRKAMKYSKGKRARATSLGGHFEEANTLPRTYRPG